MQKIKAKKSNKKTALLQFFIYLFYRFELVVLAEVVGCLFSSALAEEVVEFSLFSLAAALFLAAFQSQALEAFHLLFSVGDRHNLAQSTGICQQPQSASMAQQSSKQFRLAM